MAKHGIAGIAESRTDLFRVDPKNIVVRAGWNSRDFDDPDNQAHVEALAASISEVGVKEPLSGYMEDDKFVLTNGESRYRAVMLLLERGVEIKTVPVMPEPRHASEADHIASQFIRNSGRPFTPMENAKLFSRLLDLGWTEKDISAKTGMTLERVQQIARLNAVPESVKNHVRKGSISPTLVQRIQAKAKTAAEIEAEVEEAIASAIAEGKTKATPRHAPTNRTPKADTGSRTNYRELFEELMSYLGPDEVTTSTVGPDEGASYQNGAFTIPIERWAVMQAAAKTQGRF